MAYTEEFRQIISIPASRHQIAPINSTLLPNQASGRIEVILLSDVVEAETILSSLNGINGIVAGEYGVAYTQGKTLDLYERCSPYVTDINVSANDITLIGIAAKNDTEEQRLCLLVFE